MSVEIKCDRCGKPVKPEGEGVYSSRVTPSNIIVTKNSRGEMHDLCDDCLQKLDIFMSGEIPLPEHKTGIMYIQLPDPKVFSLRKGSWVTSNEYELHICGDLESLEKSLTEYGGFTADVKSVKEVILGVKLQ